MRQLSVREKTVSATLSLFIGALGCAGPENVYAPPPPPQVTVAKPLRKDLTLFVEEVGDTEAVDRAEVRSRVRGFVEKIEFEPGQWVERGTVLYQIEPDEYRAAFNAATAEAASAEASIRVAEADVLTAQAEVDRAATELTRQRRLVDQQATSQAELDRAVADDAAARAMFAAAESAVEAAKAKLQQAQARVEKAQLDLSYTEVRAPISGRVTKTDIKLGNLVDNGTELAAIVDDRSIFANFTVSDRQVLELRDARTANDRGRVDQESWRTVPVQLQRETDDDFPFLGNLDYVDQEGADTATGTLRVRALFENPDGGLLPGIFVRVRIPSEVREDALLLPSRAIQRDRVGPFLLVLGENDEVGRVDVRPGRESGGWTEILDGIGTGDRVIVEGVQRARPGATVSPQERPLRPEDLPPAFRAPPEGMTMPKAVSSEPPRGTDGPQDRTDGPPDVASESTDGQVAPE